MSYQWLKNWSVFFLVALGACTSLKAGDKSNNASKPNAYDMAITLAPENDKKVRLIWDSYGIPHISSLSDEAGFFGFGWAQMETRSELVLNLYARARGQSASINGSEGVNSDVLLLSLGVPEKAETWLAELRPDTRAKLSAFVDGMNAWAQANPAQIPDRLKPLLPVRETDPLAHLYNTIHVTFVSGRFLENAAEAIHETPGSNAYAISPSRSATENAMLVINPHLPWSDLFTWTELHLSLPSYDIYGVALVGSPFVGIGFSEFGGWTHTVNDIDGADLYTLVLDGEGYQLDGEARAFTSRAISFDVRQPSGEMQRVTREVRESAHGPVLFEADGQAIAVRIGAWDSYGMLDQYFEMAAAKSLEDFETAQAKLQMPFFNTLYANQDGDIYYLYGGRVPARSTGDWAFWWENLPGDRADLIWTDYLPYEALPRLTNPDTGFLQNANEPPWFATWPQLLDPADYPDFIASNELPWFRPQHSLINVLRDNSISFTELIEMKQTNHLEMVTRFKERIISAAHADGDANAILGANILAEWDGSTDANSRGAILFMEWIDQLFDAQESRIFDDETAADYDFQRPADFANLDLAVQYFGRAVDVVRDRYGDPAVAYGDVVRVRRGSIDLPGSGGEGRHGAYRVANSQEEADGTKTIVGGESFVAVVEFGNRLRAVGALTYGNTDDPKASWFGKDLHLFSENRLRSLHYYAEDILTHATVDETLSAEAKK